ncbi:MAG: HlyD family efflux transporter periplasmic adaptor subunit [Bacteroidales bacterium]|nr:HlyD family efflux transporter periplasmic adaptor subunit [Bacteroidales bacterium]
MKKLFILLILFPLGIFIAGCSGQDDLADAFGNFEATEVMISSETSGRLLEMKVEEGQKVKSGQILAVVDTTDILLRDQQLSAQYAATMAQLLSLDAQAQVFEQQIANLEKDRSRVGAMLADGAATLKQLDDITGGIALASKQMASVRSQKASVLGQADALQAQRLQTRELLDRSKVRSPMNGTVLTVFLRQGELASPGKALLKLAQLDTMILRAYFSGSQLTEVKLNQAVDVLTDDEGQGLRVLPGRISRIASEAEFTPRTIQTRDERTDLVYAVEIRVKNDGKIRIGMPGEVRLHP